MPLRSMWYEQGFADLQNSFDSWLEQGWSMPAPSPIENFAAGDAPPSDDPFFAVVGASIKGSYIAALANGSTDASATPGSQVAVTSGGITINLLFDNAAMAAPASFRSGIQQAVAILASKITDKITVNIKIDESGTGGGAAAGPDSGQYETYSWVRSHLINNASLGDSAFNGLPNATSIQGQTNVAVWNAQLKLWGVMGANDTSTDDGSATFATDIDPSLLVGVALHELTHALGRVPYGSAPDVFDFFRFTSPEARLFNGGSTAPAAYFSLDGGNTKLADYGMTSDPSDYLNSGVQGPNDPFNEFYTSLTTQALSAIDLKQLDALGFHLASTDTQAPVLAVNHAMAITEGATLPISVNVLSASDDVSSGADLRFTVIAAPSYGTLSLNGNPTSSFTEADLTNGAVTYHETAFGASADSFHFVVSDAAGNQTPTETFQIEVSDAPVFATSSILPNMNGWTALASTDINGDGTPDVIWKSDNGDVAAWVVGNGQIISMQRFGSMQGWQAAGTGDVNHDGTGDLIWQSGSGEVAAWLFNQSNISSVEHFPAMPGWTPLGAAQDGNGTMDLFWKSGAGQIGAWFVSGGQLSSSTNYPSMPGWKVIGTGDFDDNGSADVLWQSGSGEIAAWMMSKGQLASIERYSNMPGWHVIAVGDLNRDGFNDILWESDSHEAAAWLMSADGHVSSVTRYGTLPAGQVLAAGDYYHEGGVDLLFQSATSNQTQILSLDHHMLL